VGLCFPELIIDRVLWLNIDSFTIKVFNFSSCCLFA
jgi:hypothetical protein